MLDTTGELTVFLVTVGASSYPIAKRALEQQDCKVRVVEVKDVCPMSAAFQAMLDRCETRYFIQVDEDMVMKRGAVSAMYRALRSLAGSTTGMLCYAVWDKHLRIPRLGVKIYDHEIFRHFPYKDVHSCEVDQLERLKQAGYTFQCYIRPDADEEHASVMAYHGTQYTPREAFLTYRDMTWKARFVPGNEWFLPWTGRFVERVQRGGRWDDADVWAMLGCIAGHLHDRPEDGGEKDARCYKDDATFKQLERVVKEAQRRRR